MIIPFVLFTDHVYFARGDVRINLKILLIVQFYPSIIFLYLSSSVNLYFFFLYIIPTSSFWSIYLSFPFLYFYLSLKGTNIYGFRTFNDRYFVFDQVSTSIFFPRYQYHHNIIVIIMNNHQID